MEELPNISYYTALMGKTQGFPHTDAAYYTAWLQGRLVWCILSPRRMPLLRQHTRAFEVGVTCTQPNLVSSGKARYTAVDLATIIVGHLAPDLDCIAAIWILVRFGGISNAELQFVPAGETLNRQPPDSVERIIHVDTGGGRFDHHQRHQPDICAAELVRRAVAPHDPILERLTSQVNHIDHARDSRSNGFFSIQTLINGYNALFPTQPAKVADAMLLNLDAWYEAEQRQIRLEEAFAKRIEFVTEWGLGIAMESVDGGSSRLAFKHGAILYAYRDMHGWMGVAAQARSMVDLSSVYRSLQYVDQDADWYLHPNRRLLLCGTAKAPARIPSRLSLVELVRVIQGRDLTAAPFPSSTRLG